MSDNQWNLKMINHIKETDRKELQAILDELHPYDIARIYKELSRKKRFKFLLLLTVEQLASLIAELDTTDQIEVLNQLGVEKTLQAMNLMDHDDLAQLLDVLDADNLEHFLSEMKEEESQALVSLMHYPQETAGRMMTNRYVWVPVYYTVQDVVQKLRTFAEISETINYVYVVDEDKRILGVVSYRDLLLAHAEDPVADFMNARVISVPVTMDQEEVARVIERYDLLAVPVVEASNVLVGIITVDDIVDVVISEANEDIEKLSAGGKAINFDTQAWTAALRRLPWLILLLLIGLLSGSIISGFEETLAQVVALAFFMPMIAGMTGNTGTQSLAVVVRGLITRELDKRTVFRLISRELGVGVIIGVTCGALIAIIAFVWQGNAVLGLVVGSSLLVTLIIGTLAGTIIPLILYKFNVDPAIASGPLITTINDILSLSIYFGIASIFIAYLV
ncbi:MULTISPECIES: magnesium transporter [Paenibacillus]|uniref:Magnesium transporter MgtE n=1 Tax=Paenibacillus campinasensis TaxID=66347 RepID=A0A268F0I1_9BACL|nr:MULTISPECIES: magnesium transporter [Paenibacillus]MUG65586.1 magnesium transporter [Paenibacillus campinasensis]PAD78886.1 magnesium transporter [Paenibacillus campinasensis]PAK53862.1 magnesium transporter [Paenibacillus sp. 7541]